MEKEKCKSRGFQNPMTEDEKKRIKELLDSGIRQNEIARTIGRSISAVSKSIKEIKEKEGNELFDLEAYNKSFIY